MHADTVGTIFSDLRETNTAMDFLSTAERSTPLQIQAGHETDILGMSNTQAAFSSLYSVTI